MRRNYHTTTPDKSPRPTPGAPVSLSQPNDCQGPDDRKRQIEIRKLKLPTTVRSIPLATANPEKRPCSAMKHAAIQFPAARVSGCFDSNPCAGCQKMPFFAGERGPGKLPSKPWLNILILTGLTVDKDFTRAQYFLALFSCLSLRCGRL